MIIAGHTHKTAFPGKGILFILMMAAVHPRCITSIEIANNEISLIKWSVQVDIKNHLYVEELS